MKIQETKAGTNKDIIILCLKGNMIKKPEKTQVEKKILEVIDNGAKKIIIDFSGVWWIDKSGLGILDICLLTAQKNNAQFKLSGVMQGIRSLPEIAYLIKNFNTYTTNEEAIASFET